VRDAAGVGESEAGVSGGAFGEGCGENAGGGVVVVVDFGGGFAGVGAQDPPGVRDQAPFERDRPGEEMRTYPVGVEYTIVEVTCSLLAAA